MIRAVRILYFTLLYVGVATPEPAGGTSDVCGDRCLLVELAPTPGSEHILGRAGKSQKSRRRIRRPFSHFTDARPAARGDPTL